MKKKLAYAAFLLFALSTKAHAIAGDCRFQLPKIDQVFVDFMNEEIQIKGECLRNSRHPEPVVTLGTSETPLDLLFVSETDVVVALPVDALDGDYSLTLKRGLLAKAQHDLTIGAVGPPGPEGPPGADGAAGQDGAKGADGSSCSANDVPEGAQIICTDGTSATVSNGAPGEPGSDGAPGADGAQGDPGLACWDLNGNGVADVTSDPQTNEDTNGDLQVNVFDCKGDQVINLTVEIPEVPGLIAQDFTGLFPDSAQNIAEIEIVDVCQGFVVVVNGPAVEVEVVPGFGDRFGVQTPDDNSGLSTELPIVIEVFEEQNMPNPFPNVPPASPGCFPGVLNNYVSTLTNQPDEQPRDISLVTRNSAGNEVVRWNLFNYAPEELGVPGFDGRTRFTFVHQSGPDNHLHFERSTAGLQEESRNPETDLFIDVITGVLNTRWPAFLSIDESELPVRIVTLWDWDENASVLDWVERVVEVGTSFTVGEKSDMAIITPVPESDPRFPEGDLKNYFGCFPIRWEQRGGFRQEIKLKELLIIQCDSFEGPFRVFF